MWAAFFASGEARAQDRADDPAYCAARPGAHNLLQVASSECLEQRQRALAEQRKALRIAGRVPHYHGRLVAGTAIGAVGVVNLAAAFLLFMDSSNFHGSVDEDKRSASHVTVLTGAALGLVGMTIVLTTVRFNRNRDQLNALTRQMQDISYRRRDLKLMKQRARVQPYAALNGVGLRIAF